MISKTTSFRIRYGETDQMGIVYYSNYARFFEIGRTEWLRELGFSYKNMEKENVMLPAISLSCDFKKPAFYDEVLTVKTSLKKTPSVRIEFDYEITNEKGELITTGNTVLVFVNIKTQKPMKCPDYLLDKLHF